VESLKPETANSERSMSQVTLCDICGARTGLSRVRLRIASPVHPHKSEPIHERGETIDVCLACIEAVPDLSTPHTLEDLQHAAARRRANASDPD